MRKIPNSCTDPPLGGAVGFHHVIPLLQPDVTTGTDTSFPVTMACLCRRASPRLRFHTQWQAVCSLGLCGRAAAGQHCAAFMSKQYHEHWSASSPGLCSAARSLCFKPANPKTFAQYYRALCTAWVPARKGICVSSEKGNSRRNQSHMINK